MEIIDIIDINGRLTGKSCSRKDANKYGLLHQASGVIILSKLNGGGMEYSHNNALIKKKRMLDYGICLLVDILSQENPLSIL